MSEIGNFLALHPEIQTRFFKTIAKYIRSEQSAIDDYTQMEESLEDLGAPEPLIKVFRHFKKDEIEHMKLLLILYKTKRSS